MPYIFLTLRRTLITCYANRLSQDNFVRKVTISKPIQSFTQTDINTSVPPQLAYNAEASTCTYMT